MASLDIRPLQDGLSFGIRIGGLTLHQRLRLFTLAAAVGALQYFFPLPWYALLPVLGGVHALHNLWAFNAGAVLGMATPPILDDAATVLRSRTSSIRSL